MFEQEGCRSRSRGPVGVKEKKRLKFYEAYRAMMADEVRLEAYRRAIFDKVKEGDAVLDLGSGLGILAFFASQAGAGKVYAVEESEVISLAQELADLNRFDNIVFIRGKSTEITLPEKVDLVVTETFGSFGLDENIAEYMADARDRFLKRRGELIPESIECFLAPTESPRALEKINFWKKLKEKYGIDHSPVVKKVFGSIIDEEIRRSHLLSEEKRLWSLDLYKLKDRVVRGALEFAFIRTGRLHGFAGWFRARLSEDVSLSNSPDQPETHWKQAFFPVNYPVRVSRGDGAAISLALGPKYLGETGDTVINYTYACYPSSPESAMLKPLKPSNPCPCGSGEKVMKCCPDLLKIFQPPSR